MPFEGSIAIAIGFRSPVAQRRAVAGVWPAFREWKRLLPARSSSWVHGLGEGSGPVRPSPFFWQLFVRVRNEPKSAPSFPKASPFEACPPLGRLRAIVSTGPLGLVSPARYGIRTTL